MSKSKPDLVCQRYISVRDAARYLGLSEKTIRRLVDARRIPFIGLSITPKAEGAEPRRLHIRFDKSVLDGFMAQNAVIPPKALCAPLRAYRSH